MALRDRLMESASRGGVGVVDVSEWQPDADNPIFPVGSQPKRLLLCPANPSDTRLIPGHRYLFKVPIEWKAQQVWSEVIASRLGEHLGVSVPHCFVGQDAEGNVGALVEFFYGYPGQVTVPRFVHASDLLRKTIDNPKLGKPHYLRINVIACQDVLRIPDAVSWWARTLAFDAFIGNTDRHPDNWGILTFRLPNREVRYELAPAFDNGTSLGYELRDSALFLPCLPPSLPRASRQASFGLRSSGPDGGKVTQ
jgi:hypothetical protein